MTASLGGDTLWEMSFNMVVVLFLFTVIYCNYYRSPDVILFMLLPPAPHCFVSICRKLQQMNRGTALNRIRLSESANLGGGGVEQSDGLT
jgi:hypothetical protein